MGVKPKGNRKTKTDWVKNTQIKDILTNFEASKDQEILYGRRIDQIEDSTLFEIDTLGDQRLKKSLKNRVLKVDQIIAARSKTREVIPGIRPSSVKNLGKTISGRDILISKAALKQATEIAKTLKRGRGPAPKKMVTEMVDPWDTENTNEPRVSDFIAHVKPIAPKKPIVEAPFAMQMPNVPAVVVAHPGASFNPKFEDHQQILQKALDVELLKEKEKEKLDEKMSYPKELDDINDEDFFDSDEDEEVVEETTSEGVSKRTTKRKTKVQRNRAIRRKLAESEAKERQHLAIIRKDIDRIDTIAKEVDDKLAAPPKPEKPLAQPVLSKHKYKEPLLEIKLTEELNSSYRKLKPEGNLFKDRYKSLEKRAIIEPRVRVKMRRRYKLKTTETHDYKRFDAETYKNLE